MLYYKLILPQSAPLAGGLDEKGGGRTMKYQRWKVSQGAPEARQALEESGLSPLLSAVLAARGVSTAAQAARLFAPQEEPMAPPLAMADMDRAAVGLCIARCAIARHSRAGTKTPTGFEAVDARPGLSPWTPFWACLKTCLLYTSRCV